MSDRGIIGEVVDQMLLVNPKSLDAVGRAMKVLEDGFAKKKPIDPEQGKKWMQILDTGFYIGRNEDV